MSDIYQLFERSKKSVAKDLKYSESDAQLLYKLLKQFWEKNPEASNSEAFEFFQDLFINENRDIATFPSIRANSIRYHICRYLIQNPKELEISYNKIIREEERYGNKKSYNLPTNYSSNLLSIIRTLTIEALTTFREDKATITPGEARIVQEYMNSSKKAQNEFRKNMRSTGQLKTLDTYLDYFEGGELTQLQKFLKRVERELYDELKENYVESITRVIQKLDDFGVLESHNNIHHNIMERLGFPGLTYSLDAQTPDSESIRSFFQRSNIEKLDINKLSMLNSFLINRYTKELDKLNKTFFIVNSLGLWSQIKAAVPDSEGRISIDIDEKELETLYRKMNFLSVMMDNIMDSYAGYVENSDEVENVTLENGSTRKIVKVNITDKIDELEAQFGDLYRNYFSSFLPESQNNFSNDLNDYKILKNAIVNTYKIKDYNMIAALFNLYYSKGVSKNWGVILEDKSIEDCSKILLGFDIEGFNMPIRLHIDKDIVMDFLRSNQNTTRMPVYEGDPDFVVGGRKIGSQILMPLCKKQTKALREYEAKALPGTDAKRFLSHIQFLKDHTKYPEHLKVDTVVKNNGKVKVQRIRPPRRFVDLATGEQFVEEKDGTLRKIQIREDIREK